MLHCRCYQRTRRSRSTRLDFKTICPFRMIHCVSQRGLFQGTTQSWNRLVTTLCWPILLEFLFHYAKDFKPLWDWSIASEREDGGLEGLDVAVGELKSALSDILTNQPTKSAIWDDLSWVRIVRTISPPLTDLLRGFCSSRIFEDGANGEIEIASLTVVIIFVAKIRQD